MCIAVRGIRTSAAGTHRALEVADGRHAVHAEVVAVALVAAGLARARSAPRVTVYPFA